MKARHYSKNELKHEVRSTVVDSSERTQALQYELQVYEDSKLGLRSDCFGICRGDYFVEEGNVLLRVYDGLDKDTAYRMNNAICDGKYASVEQIDLELLVENAQGRELVPTERVEKQLVGQPIRYYQIR